MNNLSLTLIAKANDLANLLPDPKPTAPAELASKVSNLIGLVKWIFLAIAIISLITGLVQSLIQGHQHGDRFHLSAVTGILAAVALGSVAVVLVTTVAGF